MFTVPVLGDLQLVEVVEAEGGKTLGHGELRQALHVAVQPRLGLPWQPRVLGGQGVEQGAREVAVRMAASRHARPEVGRQPLLGRWT